MFRGVVLERICFLLTERGHDTIKMCESVVFLLCSSQHHMRIYKPCSIRIHGKGRTLSRPRTNSSCFSLKKTFLNYCEEMHKICRPTSFKCFYVCVTRRRRRLLSCICPRVHAFGYACYWQTDILTSSSSTT